MVTFRKMNLNALRVAESAARLGSFTKASEEQLITPSAVSQRISRLEDELQFKIFVRKGNLIELTHQGARLIGSIREPLDRIDLVGHTITEETIRSTVRLCIPQSMAVSWLLPKIPSFQRDYPEIFIYMSSQNRFRNFASNDFDCAIQFGNGKIANTISTWLFHQNLTPVCSAKLITQMGLSSDTVNRSHLSTATLLHHHHATENWQDWLDYENLSSVSDTAKHVYFDSRELTLEAALNGVGFAIMERETLVPFVESNRLVAPFSKDGKRKLGWHFLKPDIPAIKDPVVAFETWLVQQAQLEKSDATGH